MRRKQEFERARFRTGRPVISLLMAMLAIGSDPAMARDSTASIQKNESSFNWPIGLQFVTPSAGTVVYAGSRVEVCVEPLPGFIPVRVLIGGRDNAEFVMDAPYAATLSIPSEKLGASKLWAIGNDAEGNRFYAMLDIDVVATAVVTSITCQPHEFFFTKNFSTHQISVDGMYDDGVSRDVSDASSGTTYSSDDTSIVTVDAIGMLRSVGVGKTAIRAHNGVLESAMAVTVVGVQVAGDFNHDGAVNVADMRQLLLHLGECRGCPGDLNGDGVIDSEDVELLLLCWT